jgi:hypothetical protein
MRIRSIEAMTRLRKTRAPITASHRIPSDGEPNDHRNPGYRRDCSEQGEDAGGEQKHRRPRRRRRRSPNPHRPRPGLRPGRIWGRINRRFVVTLDRVGVGLAASEEEPLQKIVLIPRNSQRKGSRIESSAVGLRGDLLLRLQPRARPPRLRAAVFASQGLRPRRSASRFARAISDRSAPAASAAHNGREPSRGSNARKRPRSQPEGGEERLANAGVAGFCAHGKRFMRPDRLFRRTRGLARRRSPGPAEARRSRISRAAASGFRPDRARASA